MCAVEADDLLLVPLDDLCRPDLGSLRVLAGVTPGAALPEEVPALVERHPQRLQPLPIRIAGVAGCFALPGLVFLVDIRSIAS